MTNRCHATPAAPAAPADPSRSGARVVAFLAAALFVSLGCHAHSLQPVQRKMVFVLDASGSMTGVLPIAVNELKRSIDKLTPNHHFTVICYSGRGVYELHGLEPELAWGPQPATPAYQAKAGYWLNLRNHRFKTGGSGKRYAAAALEAALNYQPEMIFWLSDGLGGGGLGAARFEVDTGGLLGIIQRQRDAGGRGVRINMIQFGGAVPHTGSGYQSPMQRIADQTGGSFKYVSPRYD